MKQLMKSNEDQNKKRGLQQMKKAAITVLILWILCGVALGEDGAGLTCRHTYHWWPTTDLTEMQYAACSLCGDGIAFSIGGESAAPDAAAGPCTHSFRLAAEAAEEVAMPCGDPVVHGNYEVYPCACEACGEVVTVYRLKSITTHDVSLRMDESYCMADGETHCLPCVCTTCGYTSRTLFPCRRMPDGFCTAIGK